VGKVHPDLAVVYLTLETYLEELAESLEAGQKDALRDRYRELDILLLDDVQFLAGQTEAQEMLLSTLDALSGAGKQAVLASDRPPAEIDRLDARLLSRFEGGLLVDIGAPEYETRVAIIRKRADERGTTLERGIAEAIAKVPYQNVRELGGALNRVIAIQDLEERSVAVGELAKLLGLEEKSPDELDDFVEELSDEVATTVEEQEAPWRQLIRETAEWAELDEFETSRLRRHLEGDAPPDDLDDIVGSFRETINRLRAVKIELDAVGNPWPEAALGVLRDPERLDEAEALLASAEERARPFPTISSGPDLKELGAKFPTLVVKAAEQLVKADRPEYNPLFLWGREGAGGKALMEPTARSYGKERPDGQVAMVSAAEFAEEFIHALSAGVAGAWRERWWSADLLLVHGAETLSDTERAQDEFFHLFEALQRRGARIMLAADRAPSGIQGIDERLRSRFEGGLVLELDMDPADISLEPDEGAPEGDAAAEEEKTVDVSALDREWLLGFQGQDSAGIQLGRKVSDDEAATEEGAGAADAVSTEKAWFPSPERVVWEWRNIDERIVEEAD
jgi:chromosomal replication initiation ATPase DnaA